MLFSWTGFETIEDPSDRNAGVRAMPAVEIVQQATKFAGTEAAARDGADAVKTAPYVERGWVPKHPMFGHVADEPEVGSG